jgi:hypothetical protein
MPLYTMRPAKLGPMSDRGEDFVFSYDGVEVGRCYLGGMAGNVTKWHWTIYIAGGPGRASRPVDGVRTSGDADTLEQAQSAFKLNFEKLIAAGAVSDPRE